MAKVLGQLCEPRKSVFDPSVRDTVYNINDLPNIDASAFFEENYVTEGMKQLLTEAFSRLEGKNQNASGAYLLSQSMGGGKTHNLIALGLLAKKPELRQKVMGDFYEPGPLGTVRVAAFSGRQNTEFGIWGEIAAQLNRREVFNKLYEPLQAPGDDDWIALLDGQPTLLMFDELPPYLDGALGRTIGETTLASLTVRALANLMSAVSSGKLPQVCVVMTDLSGTAYGVASAALSDVLSNLEKEANRTVQKISPVRLNSPEFYSILRTRLFSQLPTSGEVEAVADAFGQEVQKARNLDLTTASPQNARAEIINSYPFHPGLQDLYARFRENQGFQQTRALIRLMRMVVARIWETQESNRRYLIGAQDLDFRNQGIISEINQINNSLENAIAHDIAAEGGGSVAEVIDAGQSTDAQDAARLIFMSSLSRATNPTLGLTRSDLFEYLVAPGRDLGGLNAALDTLQRDAWYLHATHAGSLLFKNTENLNAKLEAYAKGVSREDRERGLGQRIDAMFAPKVKDLYQKVEPLPALDQVQLSADQLTLVVVRPGDQILLEIDRFWENQQFRNRVIFVTANQQQYQPVLEHMGYIRAIDGVINDFKAEGMPANDPQLVDANDIKTKRESNFYMAFREAFQELHYPARNGLQKLPLNPQYAGNTYEGEALIRQALIETHQFVVVKDNDWEPFRRSVENRLWPEDAKETSWNAIKQRAATDSSWILHHPKALDDLRFYLQAHDQWRDAGNGFVLRGPFPKPAAGVQVIAGYRNPETGEVTLKIQPLNADTVKYSIGETASEYSTDVDGTWTITTSEVSISFLGVDSKGEHELGQPFEWKNTIDVKYNTFSNGDQRMLELKAIPKGSIKYTLDGSSPMTSGKAYTEPVPITNHSQLVLAYAAANGVESEIARFQIPRSSEAEKVTVDPHLPARWQRKFNRDSTTETFEFLEQLHKCNASVVGLRMVGAKDKQFWELSLDNTTELTVEEIRRITSVMLELYAGRNVTMDMTALAFKRGQDLIDLVADLKTELKPNEVKQ